MLITINEDARKNNLTNANYPVFIGVVPSYEYLNGNNLEYFSNHHNLPFLIGSFESPLNDDWTVQMERIISKNYLITKTGDQGPSFAYNPYIAPLLLNGELPFTELARFKLPDGSEGIIYKSYPSILRFVKNIRVGDQFGSLKLFDQNTLFVHPGLITPTRFEFDASAFMKERGPQTIKITGAMYPGAPEDAVIRGTANVKLIVLVDNKPVIDTVISVDKPLSVALTISDRSTVSFIVDNNGSPDADWFLLSIE